MTQAEALPADPFPDLALVYDTPVVKAYRLENGRYFTVDLDGVEISWLLDDDEQVVHVADYIAHRIVCTETDCEFCGASIDTDRVESFGLIRPGETPVPPPAASLPIAIPRQADGTTAPRRVWMTAAMAGASTAWLWRKGRTRR